MELKCSHCGTVIPAAQINIHEMVAVCPACNHVFEFSRDVVARKRKAVRPTPPPRLQEHEDDAQLTLAYRRVFGPGPLLGLIMSTVGGVFFLFMALGMVREAAPPGVIGLTLLLAALMWYLFAVAMTTTTEIAADEHAVTISSGPLPFPIKDDKQIRTHDIARVYMEQTTEAMSGGVPANHVYAELRDGSRVTVVSSLPYKYAFYIAQIINEHVHAERALPQLADDMPESGVLEADDGELDPVLAEAMQADTEEQSQARH